MMQQRRWWWKLKMGVWGDYCGFVRNFKLMHPADNVWIVDGKVFEMFSCLYEPFSAQMTKMCSYNYSVVVCSPTFSCKPLWHDYFLWIITYETSTGETRIFGFICSKTTITLSTLFNIYFVFCGRKPFRFWMTWGFVNHDSVILLCTFWYRQPQRPNKVSLHGA